MMRPPTGAPQKHSQESEFADMPLASPAKRTPFARPLRLKNHSDMYKMHGGYISPVQIPEVEKLVVEVAYFSPPPIPYSTP